jgi:hypothetical protein
MKKHGEVPHPQRVAPYRRNQPPVVEWRVRDHD